MFYEVSSFFRNIIRPFRNPEKVIPRFLDPYLSARYYPKDAYMECDEEIEIYYGRLKGQKKEKAKKLILKYLSFSYDRATISKVVGYCRVLKIKEALPLLNNMMDNIDQHFEKVKNVMKDRIKFVIRELSK